VYVDLAHNIGGFVVGLWQDAFGGSDTVDRSTVEAYAGTSWNDQMQGDGGDGTYPLYSADFSGLGGNDTLTGSGLAEQLDGGDDDDVLRGLSGSDTLTGGNGNDTMTGGTGAGVGTGQLTSAILNFGPGAGAGGWNSQDGTPRQVGDIDGDGVADIVGFGNQRTFTSLNDGSGTFGDILGGIDNFSAAQGWKSQDGQLRLLGDIDGDGDDDIIGFGTRSGFVASSNGDGTFSDIRKSISNFTQAQGWHSNDETPRLMGDVNGDGIDDIICFGAKRTFTVLGLGDGTFGPVQAGIENFSRAQGWSSNDSFLRLVGDVNGDGMDDIVGFGRNATFTALSNGDGTFGDFRAGLGDFGAAQGWLSNDATPRLLGDVNGDGLDDVIGLGRNKTFAALAVGDGTFGPLNWMSSHFNRATGWTSFDSQPRAVADLNSDGAADLVGFSTMGVLTQASSAESDVFVFADGFGTDLITDFDPGIDGDRLDVSGVSAFGSLTDVMAAASQVGADTVITDGDNTVRLANVDMSDLTAADFVFG
jgi:hypothetical protein